MTSFDPKRRELLKLSAVTGGAIAMGELWPENAGAAENTNTAAAQATAAPAPVDVDAARKRHRAPARTRCAHDAARCTARAPASYRVEERLRTRTVRRVHRAAWTASV